MNFLLLPDVVLNRILSFLDGHSILSFRLICKDTKALVDSRPKLLQKFQIMLNKVSKFEAFMEQEKMPWNNFYFDNSLFHNWIYQHDRKFTTYPLMEKFALTYASTLKEIEFLTVRPDHLIAILRNVKSLESLCVYGIHDFDYQSGCVIDKLVDPHNQFKFEFNSEELIIPLQGLRYLTMCTRGPHFKCILNAARNLEHLVLRQRAEKHSDDKYFDDSALPTVLSYIQLRCPDKDSKSHLKVIEFETDWDLKNDEFLALIKACSEAKVQIRNLSSLSLDVLNKMNKEEKMRTMEYMDKTLSSFLLYGCSGNIYKSKSAEVSALIEIRNMDGNTFSIWENGITSIKLDLGEIRFQEASQRMNMEKLAEIKTNLDKIFIKREDLKILRIRCIPEWRWEDADIHWEYMEDPLTTVLKHYDFSLFPNLKKLEWMFFYHPPSFLWELVEKLENLQELLVEVRDEYLSDKEKWPTPEAFAREYETRKKSPGILTFTVQNHCEEKYFQYKKDAYEPVECLLKFPNPVEPNAVIRIPARKSS